MPTLCHDETIVLRKVLLFAYLRKHGMLLFVVSNRTAFQKDTLLPAWERRYSKSILHRFIGQPDSSMDGYHSLLVVHLKMHCADAQDPFLINIVLGLSASLRVMWLILAGPGAAGIFLSSPSHLCNCHLYAPYGWLQWKQQYPALWSQPIFFSCALPLGFILWAPPELSQAVSVWGWLGRQIMLSVAFPRPSATDSPEIHLLGWRRCYTSQTVFHIT